MRFGLALVAVVGCSNPPSAAHPDGSVADAPVATDAMQDALVDTPDAMLDAQTSVSPACTTTPAILVDVFPRRIANLARSGNTLYVSAYEVVNQAAANPTILAIDLVGGSVTPFTPDAPVALWPSGGDVFASERAADGTIWQLHQGAAPVALVQHRATPTVAMADAGYVYWGEEGDGTVKRRLIAGGAVELVMACQHVRDLVVVGNEIYCAYDSSVLHSLKAGGGTPMGIATGSYPILTMIEDGPLLYFIDLKPFPDVYKIDTTTETATLVNELTSIGRYMGFAATSDYFYMTESGMMSGLRRMSRATLQSADIVQAVGLNQDPVVWNSELFYAAADSTNPGERYVMHCVD